jgi:hypothetical protein
VTSPGREQPNSQLDCCRVNVLVLTVEGFNATLNVAVMDEEVVETAVAPSSGVVLVTNGGIATVVNDHVLGAAKLTPFVSWTFVLMVAVYVVDGCN